MPHSRPIPSPEPDGPEHNPNFDKGYFIREIERLDFLDGEDISVPFGLAFFEDRERIRRFAGNPSEQVKKIKGGT